MAATIQCPACCGESDPREGCQWCRGAGVLVDMGATPGVGGKPAPEPLERRVVHLLAPKGGGLVALASDGSVWLTTENEAEPWERFPDLPQPLRQVDGLELERARASRVLDSER